MKIHSFAAVLWRKQVSETWQQCVLQRSSLEEFLVFSSETHEQLDSYNHGRNEDGSLLDDSVEGEWALTLAPPLSETSARAAVAVDALAADNAA
eukprot:6148534-Pleurochrysis_carterae.AAC.1